MLRQSGWWADHSTRSVVHGDEHRVVSRLLSVRSRARARRVQASRRRKSDKATRGRDGTRVALVRAEEQSAKRLVLAISQTPPMR